MLDLELKILPPQLRIIWQRLYVAYETIHLRLLENHPATHEYAVFRHDFGRAVGAILSSCNFDWNEDLTIISDAQELLAPIEQKHTAQQQKNKTTRMAGEEVSEVDDFAEEILNFKRYTLTANIKLNMNLMQILDQKLPDLLTDVVVRKMHEFYPESVGVMVESLEEFCAEVKKILAQSQLRNGWPVGK